MGLEKLNEGERDVIRLAAEDKTRKEIMRELGIAHQTLRNRISSLCGKLEVGNFYAATAQYGHDLGLGARPLVQRVRLDSDYEREQVAVPENAGFRYGSLSYPAMDVSSELVDLGDIECVLESDGEWYEPPSALLADLSEDIHLMAKSAERDAISRAEVAYEDLGRCLAVRSLVAGTERYVPLTLTLQRVDYLMQKGIKENLTLELKRKYTVHPRQLREPGLPLLMAVALHVTVGDPPHLIVGQRSGTVGTYARFYAAAVEALGEGLSDVRRERGKAIFDPASAMLRELEEERYRVQKFEELRESLGLLCLVYDYRVYTYILVGHLHIPHVRPDVFCQELSRAKEASHYEALPYPQCSDESGSGLVEEERQKLRRLCAHLLHNSWTPCSAIGLVIKLRREFGAHQVQLALG